MELTKEEYQKRIKAIIERNITPSGPNMDAKALIWALDEIRELESKLKSLGYTGTATGCASISTTWGDDGF